MTYITQYQLMYVTIQKRNFWLEYIYKRISIYHYLTNVHKTVLSESKATKYNIIYVNHDQHACLNGVNIYIYYYPLKT